MALGYDGSVRIKADLNHNAFDKGISSMTASVNKFGSTLKKMAGFVTAAFGIAAIVQFGKESVKLASDIEEVQNVIDVTFGKGAAQIEEFAQSAAAAFGLSELSAKQYTGTMGAMLKSSGLLTKDAQEMSVALTGLAGDIASFYNLDANTAFEKIRSGISGETEPLRQLGINMSVANLEAYALTQGITKSYNAMSQAEQVMLRYNYLLNVTTDAQGDFARTSGSFANQVRILQLNFDQLRISLGNGLIPIAQAVLPSINAVIAGLTKLAQVFAKVTALLFGKSTQVKETGGVASSAASASTATDQLADSLGDAGEAAKKAGKDMQSISAPFDEFNILADNAAGSASDLASDLGGIGAGDTDLAIPEYEADTSGIEETGEALKSLGEIFSETVDSMLAGIPALKAAFSGFATNFNEFNQKLYKGFTFDGLKEKVQQLGVELAEAFNDLVMVIDWELWGRSLGAGLDLGLQFLVNFLYSFDWIGLGQSLAESVNGIVYEVDWYAFGQLLWTHFKLALETFAGFILGLDMPALAEAASNIVMGFFDSIQETITKIDWNGIGRQIAEFLNNVDWNDIIDSISDALESMVDAGLDLVAGFIENVDPEILLAAIAILAGLLVKRIITAIFIPFAKELVSGVIKQIAEEIASSGLSSILGTIGRAIAGIGTIIAGVSIAVTSFFDMWNNGFGWAKEAVMLLGVAMAAVGAIILGVPALVAGVVAAIVAAVATMAVVIHEHWEEIKQWFIDMWEGIKETANAIGEWFNTNVILPVTQFFSDMWNGIKQFASDAWAGIQEIWNVVTGWFNETIIEPLKNFFVEFWETVKQLASSAWDGISGVWSVVSEWFNTTVIQPVQEFFSGLWDGIKQTASDIWEEIKNVWSAAASWFSDNVTTPLKNAFDVAIGGIKSAINSLIGNIEGMINSLIKGVNWLISQLNKISFDVPDWVPSWAGGGKSFGINIPKISETKLPRLANGAVIPPNQQFAAILGDQRSGKNIEAPAGLIRQMVMEGIQAASGIGGGNQPITVNVMLDKKVVATATINEINRMTRSGGRSPILGAG